MIGISYTGRFGNIICEAHALPGSRPMECVKKAEIHRSKLMGCNHQCVAPTMSKSRRRHIPCPLHRSCLWATHRCICMVVWLGEGSNSWNSLFACLRSDKQKRRELSQNGFICQNWLSFTKVITVVFHVFSCALKLKIYLVIFGEAKKQWQQRKVSKHL